MIYGAIGYIARSGLVWLFFLLALGNWFGAETGYVSGWGAYWLGMNYPIRFVLFGGALLIISLILLNNTIRVTIFSKRYLIHTMKLVGATRWFITKPFLGGSILQGIYAGLISWAMLAVMIAGLHEGLPEVKFVSDQLQLLFIFGAMMVGGILISLVFTAFAVRKFLRMRTDKLYLY